VQISGGIYIAKFRCLLRTTGRKHILEKVGERNNKIIKGNRMELGSK
jgi:hypothetical protein